MLFDLMVDVFQQMVSVTNETVHIPLSLKISDLLLAFQYADDTVLVVGRDTLSLMSLKIILRLFTAVSGLQINFTKSTFIPINLEPIQVDIAQAILGCQRTDFPVQYLRMSLIVKKPDRSLFMPLVERME